MNTLREALENAIEEDERDSNPEATLDATATEEPTQDSLPFEDTPAEPGEGDAEPGEDNAEGGADQTEEADSAAPELDTSPEEPAAASSSAPASWRSDAKGVWSDIPAAAQQEILKRESDIARGLQESAEERKVGKAYRQIVAPFEAIIASQGAESTEAGVAALLRTAATLSVGTTHDKASTVANLVKYYGVDLEALDKALVGQLEQGPEDQNKTLQSMVSQAVAPLQQQLQDQQNQTIQRELSDFASNHEHYESLKMEMADWLDFAKSKGQSMTLQQAYDRALAQHPELVSAPVAAAGGNGGASVSGGPARAPLSPADKRARMAAKVAAAASVAPAGAPADGPQGLGLRDTIAAAWEGED